MSDRPADAPKITEREWQVTIETLARWCGWRVYHTYDSRRSNAGFPDLVLVHPDGRLIFAELKTETGKVTKAQEAWLHDLESADKPTAVVWRPSSIDAAKKALERPIRPTPEPLGDMYERHGALPLSRGGLEV